MKGLSSIFLKFILVFFLFQSQSFALPACGFSQKCADGLVCVGATGIENNGICVLSGPSIAICKTTKFVKDFAKYFELFSIVALGFAFFLGKISWGMIISVILGIAVIEGAVPITQKLAGTSATYCSDETITYISNPGCRNPKWITNSTKSKMNSTNVYNNTVTKYCPSPYSCIKYVCKLASDPGTSVFLSMPNYDTMYYSNLIIPSEKRIFMSTVYAAPYSGSNGGTNEEIFNARLAFLKATYNNFGIFANAMVEIQKGILIPTDKAFYINQQAQLANTFFIASNMFTITYSGKFQLRSETGKEYFPNNIIINQMESVVLYLPDKMNEKLYFVPIEFANIGIQTIKNRASKMGEIGPFHSNLSSSGLFSAQCIPVQNADSIASNYLLCTHSCSGITKTVKTTASSCENAVIT